VWKSCDWRPLTGVTGSLVGSLSVSSPSSSIELVRSVGYWKGDDEMLDRLESDRGLSLASSAATRKFELDE